ncbi:MAG: tetratricopeptide repeat protein [Candidatus Eisenbacteria sp.]|nr:tetratricopeptide repeat protein [Candidatus Eisenbacteria bacterium]
MLERARKRETNADPKKSARPRIALPVRWLIVGAFLTAASPVSPSAADETNWGSLREAVVDLEVVRPSQPESSIAYGFYMEGVDGIVACCATVRGAERLVVIPAKGEPFEVTSYVACDPQSDLIVLKAPKSAKGLSRSSHLLFSQGQTGFAILPPSVGGESIYKMGFVNMFEGAGMGDMMALWGNISPGLPLADSLGKVVGVINVLREGGRFVACGIPIDRVTKLLAKPDRGGALLDLSDDPIAPWIQPETAEGSQIMGAVLCRARKFEAGIALLRRALDKNPQLVEAMLEWGMAYQIQSEHVEAERLYKEALEIRPNYPKGHLYLGSCYFVQGMYLKAEDEYDIALEQDPSWPVVYVNLGGLYFLQQRKALAETTLRRALDLAPLMGLARCNLGVMYYAQRRIDEAREQYEFLRSRKSGFAPVLARQTHLDRP